LDLSRMNRVLRVDVDDADCTVQAGVRRKQLNAELAPTGLFFPVDPGADATLGGMAATRASGTSSVRYGTMRDNVIALQVVLADGRLIETGSRARKSASGYDLTRLFVGSEGTLGVITEVTLRLYPVPAYVVAAVAPFGSLAEAVGVVVKVRRAGIPIGRIELLDALMIRGINAYAGLTHPEAPTLFMEFSGTREEVEGQLRQVEALVRAGGGRDFTWASDAGERAALWHARHNAHYAAKGLRPGARSKGTDVCVPLSRLAECLARVQADMAGTFLMAPLVGHVGDGNFHLQYLIDPERPEEVAESERLHEQLVRHALELGGTCSGEHGVGLGKTRFMAAEHGEALHVLHTIKQALDPAGLLNPGKMLPPA
ncbi:MAG: FAD-linked oxidase C-terminal domain-containing protein, partial [Rhodothermales bacterium]